MNDDWRLQIDPKVDAHATSLVEHLASRELQHDLSDAYHDRLIVTRDGSRIFVYAGARKQAEEAHRLIDTLAQQHGWTVDVQLRHWHPIAEDWEDPANEPPDTETTRMAEHKEAIAAEDQKVRDQGYPDFEVRVVLPSHHDAVNLAEKLRGEGLLPVRRWKYLVVGAADEDGAQALADRLHQEVPDAREVRVEGTWKAAIMAEASANPFAMFGGIAG
jgi:hypothetical protein